MYMTESRGDTETCRWGGKWYMQKASLEGEMCGGS